MYVIIFMHKERRDRFNTHVKCRKFRVRINIHICNSVCITQVDIKGSLMYFVLTKYISRR